MGDICDLPHEQLFAAAFMIYHKNRKKWPHKVCARALQLTESEFSARYQTFTTEESATPEEVFPELTKVPTEHRSAFKQELERKRRELIHQRTRRQNRRRAGSDFDTAEARVQQTNELRTQDSASAPWKRIIWVGFPDNPPPWNVKDSKSLCLEILDSDREMGGMDWLTDNDISELERGLGSFYWKAKNEIRLHQGLATMLIARSLSSVPIELHPWRWLQIQLRDNARGLRSHLTDSEDRPVSAVIILHCTTSKPKDLFDVCGQIESLPNELSIRCFPKKSELSQDQGKFDWEVLDEIAARSKIPQYRFRPTTCPGRGDCLLADRRVTFMKRNHSSGGAHTGYQIKSDRGFLQCDIRDKSVEKKSDPEGYHWFHQQYIDSLDLREILVDIAMESDPKGIRGLRGRVVQKVITKRDLDNRISSRALDASDLENEDCGWYTEEKLDKFALWVIDQLLELPDVLERFESLNVCCRLDIGFCHGNPFVNEVGRGYNAHFFSLSGSAEPFTKMAKAAAISLLRYLGLLKSD